MKGLVLSGGRGVRLDPLTRTWAKQLLPLANRPVLRHALDRLAEAGVTDIGVITGHTQDQVKAALGDGSELGVSLTYIHQAAPLGLAHAVTTARDYLGVDPFVMYLGDNFLERPIGDLVSGFEATGGDATILLSSVDEPQHYGIAELEGSRIVRVVEKPAFPPSSLALVGLYLFTSAIFSAIERIQPSARGELEITDAIGLLISDGATVNGRMLDGMWTDTGYLDGLLRANRWAVSMLHGSVPGWVHADSIRGAPVVIGSDVEISDTFIEGPAVIGDGAKLAGCHIGPHTSVGRACHLERVATLDTILTDGVLLHEPQAILHSVVTPEARLMPGEWRGRAQER